MGENKNTRTLMLTAANVTRILDEYLQLRTIKPLTMDFMTFY